MSSNAPRQLRASEPAGPLHAPAADVDTGLAQSAGNALPAWSDSPRQLKQGAQLTQLQAAASSSATPAQGGLPQGLRQGIESMSGLDMSGVRVHRNSSKPAALQAHAYAQGQDIHLGPGQEKHLPHEAWHVVQQAQGRVRPTSHRQGTPVNTETALEREADTMGSKAPMVALQRRAATSRLALGESEVLQGYFTGPPASAVELAARFVQAKFPMLLDEFEQIAWSNDEVNLYDWLADRLDIHMNDIYDWEDQQPKSGSMGEQALEQRQAIDAPRYGGAILDKAPADAERIGYHYTSPELEALIQASGIQISEELSGKESAVGGVNQDGEGFYTTDDKEFPYHLPNKTSIRFAVYMPKDLLGQLRRLDRSASPGFENVRWWQNDPGLRRLIVEYDYILRVGANAEIKLNPHMVPYIALVREASKQAVLPANHMAGFRMEFVIPDSLQQFLLGHCKAIDNFDTQQQFVRNNVPRLAPETPVGAVFKWMKGMNIAASPP
ncbi:DUF4157 domain-containing protein [Paucibacter sp. DJ1R-11]|uniref:eCIS core domain-containing protein n=1 Tax=Paucibacter sp. DJ1R-11 TaxID=2893556 RepID=UPI0021E3F6E6|nr:DUF4157 domain-containing protein [Paucibacter sp. DJ1R-11]MCV2363931.1 DUF4157 domain-containing protein [Paucibacter sp. DJ1R-11]